MFESIAVLPNKIKNHPLDIGDLAEKMLYYKRVIVFANKSELVTLFNYFDIDLLIEYIKRGYLQIKNRRKSYGAGLIGGSYLADFMTSPNYDLKKNLYDAYFEYCGDKEKSSSAANKLYRHIGIYETPSKFANEVNLDLEDPAFVKSAIIKTIEYYHPQEAVAPESFDFTVKPQPDGTLVVNSSIDVAKYPFLDTPSILLNIGTAIEDTKISANFSSELSVPELNSKVISVKLNSLITKASANKKDIEIFQYAEFSDAPSLQEVINNKHRSMAEYLKVLEEGEKFKGWLTELGEGNKLIKEYTKKVNEKTWLQTAPSKAGRFYLFQGVSTILKATGTLTGIAAGIGLSAANTFLIEKLGKGWKPNHYIENSVKPFIQTEKKP